jgi:hypothetical protein
MLGDLLDCSVIYEDIEYLCPCDVMRDAAGKPQVPSGDRIEFSYQSGANAFEVIEACVQTYNEQARAGKFEVHRIGSGIHVFPTLSRDANGDYQPRQSLLDAAVPPRGSNMSPIDHLDQMIQNISAARSVSITRGEIPEEIQKLPPSPAEGRTAAQVLSDLADLSGKKLFWELQYDPREVKYVLNGYVRRP